MAWNFDPIQFIFELPLSASRVYTNELAKVIKRWLDFVYSAYS